MPQSDDSPQGAHDLISKLREPLRLRKPLDAGQLAKSLAGLIPLIAPHARRQGSEASLIAPNLAVTLLSLARQAGAGSAQAKKALAGLARLGPFGAIMAARLVEERLVSPDAAEAALADEPLLLLELVNRACLAAREPSSPLGRLGVELLPLFAEAGLEAASPFLVEVADMEPGLSFAVQAALLPDRPFGQDEDRPKVRALKGLRGPYRRREILEAAIGWAGAERSPSRLVGLLEAIGGLGLALDAAQASELGRLIGHSGASVRQACLRALSRLGAPGLGKVAAWLYQGGRMRQEILGCLPMAGEAELGPFLAGLAPDARGEAAQLLFMTIGRADPVGLAKAVESVRRELGQDAASLAAPPALQPRVPAPDISEAPAGEPGPPSRTGQPRDRATNRLTPPEGPPSQSGFVIKEASHARRQLTNETVTQAVFEGCLFDEASLVGCRFIDCTFTGSSLKSALFKDCELTGCRFEDCDLGQTRLIRVSLTDCTLDACILAGASLKGCDARQSEVLASNLHDARLVNSAMRCCRLAWCDLSGMTVHGSRLLGVNLDDCLAVAPRLVDSTFLNTPAPATTFSKAFVLGLDTDSPILMRLERATLAGLMEEAAADVWDSTGMSGKNAGPMEAVVLEWAARQDAAHILEGFLEDDHGRLDWLKRRLGERGSWLSVVPLALHANLGKGPDATGSCRIQAYHPDLTSYTRLRAHFPEAWLPADSVGEVAIESLSLVGGLATLAGPGAREARFWLMARPDATDMEKARIAPEVADKVEAVRAWASTALGLEARFLLSDMRGWRAGRLGWSETDSGNEAQTTLLKEEFHREGLHLAGRLDTWRLTRPSACGQVMAKVLCRCGEDRFMDLGPLAAEPLEDLLGASLWRLAMTLDDPLKTLLAEGLVSMALAKGKLPMLGESRKEAILAGSDDPWRTDPLGLVYAEVARHLWRLGDTETLDLLKRLLALDADLSRLGSADAPPLAPAQAVARHALRRLDEPFKLQGLDLDPGGLAHLAYLVELGERADRLILKRFGLILEGGALSGSRGLSPEDQTRIKRRLFAALATGEGKVDRATLLRGRDHGLDAIMLSLERTPGKTGAHLLQAGRQSTATRRIEYAPVKRMQSLPGLLAWLAQSGLLDSGPEVQADASLTPVTAHELASALAALQTVLPPAPPAPPAPETTLAALTQPERITRAFFLLNLFCPRATSELKDISVIYATNWGETRYLTVPSCRLGLVLDPAAFLSRHAKTPLEPGPHMAAFMPERSACRVAVKIIGIPLLLGA